MTLLTALRLIALRFCSLLIVFAFSAHLAPRVLAQALQDPSNAIQCEYPLDKHLERHRQTGLSKNPLYQLDSLKTLRSDTGLNHKTIGKISIYRLSVFDESDPKENNLLFKLLNKIHIRTKSSVIRNQLLFKEKQPFNIEQVKESERLLRSRIYLADALIAPERICENTIDLAVITRDSWALETTAGFSEEGNQTTTNVSVRSTNLLGTGDFAAVSYQTSPERDKVRYQYSSPHFLGSRFRTGIYYSDNSDGSERQVSFSRPFYSQHTPISYGLSLEQVTSIKQLKQQNSTILNFEKSESQHEIFAGYALDSGKSTTHTQRIILGIRREQNEILSPTPSDNTRQYPWISYFFTENDFGKFRNINRLHKTEDLNLGARFYTQWGLNDELIVFNTSFSDSLFSGEKQKHLIGYTIGAQGTYLTKNHEHENSIAYASFTYHYLYSDQQRWYTHWRFDQGFGLTAVESLSFTDDYILRGYPSGYEFGDKRLIGSVEHRIFYDYHFFNLFRVGRVAFVDVGRAWGKTPASKPSSENNQALYNVGFGLRFSSTKSRVKNVVHADIAFPLNDRKIVDRYQFTIKTQQRF